jgi:hypothetical protein
MAGLLALPKLPPTKARGRVHRLDDEPEEPAEVCEKGRAKPEILPFVAVGAKGELLTTKGEAMPKGVYDRSKSKPRTDESANDAAPPRQKKPRKARALAVVPKVKVNGANAVAPFGASLDLRSGAVTINASAGSLALAPDEVMALLGFLRGR